MVKIQVTYEGDLHTIATHLPSGQTLHTDAPLEDEEKAMNFSPTDLFATSLATCIATVMGIYAERKNIDLRGMQVFVQKKMTNTPYRRIAKLEVILKMPENIPETEKKPLEKVAKNCPVYRSMHADIEHSLEFQWNS